MKNPRVFLDITIGTRTGGRVIIELFADVTPRTAENFRGLCTGEYGLGRNSKKKLCYENCSFFRCVKGFMVQSGDFQFNSGDGGESIYGGSFADEDFTRRHTQAGVLSMANKGRNTNTSQFFITLKRAVQLDGKHVAFGQVVDGMDVIRAIAQVPTDSDDRPRVAITIVGSGEVDKKTVGRSQADPHQQLSKAIADLSEDVAPTGAKVQEAAKGRAILAGKPGGAPVPEERASGQLGDEEEPEEAVPTRPARSERERKLFELRMKMNQCRNMNNKDVIEEQKRNSDPEFYKKKAEERQKRAMDEEDATGKEARMSGKGAGGRQGAVPEGKKYLEDTVEQIEMRQAKKKKKDPNVFGWDVFNQDSLARAHDKRLSKMEFDEKAYTEQKQLTEGDPSLAAGFGYKASEAQKERLGEAIDKMLNKKSDFSRRREHVAEEDVTYVNERNRVFNQKLNRSFGAYTEEVRQNLERGTAL